VESNGSRDERLSKGKDEPVVMEVCIFYRRDTHNTRRFLKLFRVKIAVSVLQTVKASRLCFAQQRLQRHRIPRSRSETFAIFTHDQAKSHVVKTDVRVTLQHVIRLVSGACSLKRERRKRKYKKWWSYDVPLCSATPRARRRQKPLQSAAGQK
jgi:hypothetical protein